MAWDSTKTDGSSTLPASEYNTMVTYIKSAITSSGNVTADVNLDNKGIILDPTPTSDHTCNGTKVSLTAGATFTIGQIGYVNGSSQPVLTDADADSTSTGMLVMATAGITSGNAGVYLLQGMFRDDSWTWTPGGKLYLSTTPGAITQTAPTGSADVVRIIGYAVSADVIYFNPSNNYVLLT